MNIVFVVAVAANGVIGRGNALPWQLPWHLKSDLRRLKRLTLGKPVVMGRKTFASIGKPLPGRTNIVMTRDVHFRTPGAIVATSLRSAQDIALGDALRRFVTEIMVIGGADIFAQWADFATRLEVTEVHAEPAGDTFLEPIDLARWQEVARTRHAATPADSADFSYVTYLRRGAR